MKKNRGDEPIWMIIHIYMEISQGNVPCSYLKQAKMLFFSFLFYKIREQEGRAGPAWEEGGNGRRKKVVEKGCRRINMVQILCTHVCKSKNGTS
jgi:hypothetical protein